MLSSLFAADIVLQPLFQVDNVHAKAYLANNGLMDMPLEALGPMPVRLPSGGLSDDVALCLVDTL